MVVIVVIGGGRKDEAKRWTFPHLIYRYYLYSGRRGRHGLELGIAASDLLLLLLLGRRERRGLEENVSSDNSLSFMLLGES